VISDFTFIWPYSAFFCESFTSPLAGLLKTNKPGCPEAAAGVTENTLEKFFSLYTNS
jgi:hypothetical protein